MSDFTEQQVQETADVERKFGSYGNLVFGVNDPELTDFQRQHCLRVFKTGVAAFGAKLSREYGTYYPLSALAEKIDAGIARHTTKRDEVTV